MLTAERLREVLRYYPETGMWEWLVRSSNRAPKGLFAGCLRKRGDRAIRIDGVEYKCHRLAWLYMTGKWPPDQVDHKNLCRADNWWTNLRLANNSQNSANKLGRAGTQTGVKNVSYYPKKSKPNPYVAYGSRNQKRVYLGSFPTLEAAAAAAFAHAQQEFGEFARAA